MENSSWFKNDLESGGLENQNSISGNKLKKGHNYEVIIFDKPIINRKNLNNNLSFRMIKSLCKMLNNAKYMLNIHFAERFNQVPFKILGFIFNSKQLKSCKKFEWSNKY
ncbi:hypothetical protein BpHYR1_041930 [Brachionus plicatilis]|uniref:Uncharacterized protein n=1 Tax=Brachionus plicatilis TaxID=10195 RepID=A0A3M7QNL1_BRAPC|nr:hypothetical protein BpHYR1_041930 [Brachionus plicatilis]